MVDKIKFEPQLVLAERISGSAVSLTNKEKLSLYKKSQNSGYSTDILEEVYRRGFAIWNQSFGGTPEQFAFDRVNSFVSGGFAFKLDEDLLQEGLWDNIRAKRNRIKHGSGERMRKPGEKGAPTKEAIRAAQNEEYELEEAESGLAKKAAASGISIGTLRKVYNRGMAAWNSGHRPGTTPQQWGMARVNSYITKGKTYHTADKDLHEEEMEEAANAAQQAAIAIAMKKAGKKPKNEEYSPVQHDKESGLPRKYVAGLSAETAKERAAHWEKTSKMSDRDPRAYTPAPGDANAKTKESKYTKKYKQMYGEETTMETKLSIIKRAVLDYTNINEETIKHNVVTGDTAWDLAKKYNTTVDAIKAANPQIKDIGTIIAGKDVLNIPGKSTEAPIPAPRLDRSKTTTTTPRFLSDPNVRSQMDQYIRDVKPNEPPELRAGLDMYMKPDTGGTKTVNVRKDGTEVPVQRAATTQLPRDVRPVTTPIVSPNYTSTDSGLTTRKVKTVQVDTKGNPITTTPTQIGTTGYGKDMSGYKLSGGSVTPAAGTPSQSLDAVQPETINAGQVLDATKDLAALGSWFSKLAGGPEINIGGPAKPKQDGLYTGNQYGTATPSVVPAEQPQKNWWTQATDVVKNVFAPRRLNPKTGQFEVIGESYFKTGETAETQSTNPNDPSSRFDATTSAVNVYAGTTPGQQKRDKPSKAKRVIKKVVAESLICENCSCGLKEEILNERGADSKGYFRSTESGAGLTAKGAAHFRRQNPGSKLSTAVTEKNPKGRRAARRRSFCARMSGMKGPMKDEKGRPTRKAMSLRRWRC